MREAKQAARAVWLAERLAERRAEEAAAAEAAIMAFELEVEALALAAIAERRACRRTAAQACLDLMETEAAAKRRRTRRVLRRLCELKEEKLTLDEMLAADEI